MASLCECAGAPQWHRAGCEYKDGVPPQEQIIVGSAIEQSDAQLARQLQNQQVAEQQRALRPPTYGIPVTNRPALNITGTEAAVEDAREQELQAAAQTILWFACLDVFISAMSIFYLGIFGFIFIMGPLCGVLGARRRNKWLILVYFVYCILRSIFILNLIRIFIAEKQYFWTILNIVSLLIEAYIMTKVWKFFKLLSRANGLV